MDCHWASKVEVPFPFFPLPYVLLVQSLTQFFLQCLASIKFILELSLFHDSFSGLALASTSIHSGLPPGMLSSLATSAGVSFPLTLPRSGDCWQWCLHIEFFPQSHIFLHNVTLVCRTWSLSRVLKVENRSGNTFQTSFPFVLQFWAEVSHFCFT